MTRKPFIVAHRGLSGLYPENTLLAFEKALELPVDAIEFDLHPTADGEVVITHDDTLERCSDGAGPVRERTLAELKALDFGSWKGSEFAGVRLPTFVELLDLVEARRPDIFLCVELKENSESCARQALEELRRRNRLHRCSIISFHPEMLRLADSIEPGLELHGFIPSGMDDAATEAYYRLIRRIGIWHLDATAELVESYHRRGIRVDVWATDTAETFRRAVDLGIDFITTNRADVCCREDGRL